MRFPASQITEPVSVRTATGSGAYGTVYAEQPVTTRCQYEGAQELVRDGSGAEVVTSGIIRVAPGTTPGLDLEATFAVDSEVTVRGRSSRVAQTQPYLHTGQLIYVEVKLA